VLLSAVPFGGPSVISNDADHARSVFAADVDGDGGLDAHSASSGDKTIAWYENTDGFGRFGPPQVITATADKVSWVYATDLDGDGDADTLASYSVTTAPPESNTIYLINWFENTNGLGSFGPAQPIAFGAGGGNSVDVADLDGDTDVDVLTTSFSHNKVAWYENTDGAGTFSAQKIVGLTSGAHAAWAVDVDGDGHLDVLGTSPSHEDADNDGSDDSYWAISWNGDGAGEFSFGFTYLYEDLFTWADDSYFYPGGGYQLPGVDIDMVGGWDLWGDTTNYRWISSKNFLPVGLHQPDVS